MALVIDADHIREVGRRYDIKLSGTINTKASTLLVFAIFCLICLAIPGIPFFFLLRFVQAPFLVWLILTLTFGAVEIWWGTVEWFLVNVPKYSCLITTSYFSGMYSMYTVGWHLKSPWESYIDQSDIQEVGVGEEPATGSPTTDAAQAAASEEISDFISLRTESFTTTSKFQTKQGVPVEVTWSMQIDPNPYYLPLHVLRRKADVIDGFREVGVKNLGQEIQAVNIADILDPALADHLQTQLERDFETKTDTTGSTTPERFGANFRQLSVEPPQFGVDYQQTLTASVQRAIITGDVKDMADKLGISSERAMDTVMILNKEGVTKQIFDIQAGQQFAALAPVLARALREAGDVGRGAQAATGGGTPEGGPTPPSSGGPTPPTTK
jgi:hypothetical protein